MNEFVISYTSPFGRQQETGYCTNDTRIDLYMRSVQEIELEPISSCHQLQVLELSKNQIQEIDLNPLASCSKLRRIRIRENRLESINLWPLSGNDSLEEIDLASNDIKELDASPVLPRSLVILDWTVKVLLNPVFRYTLRLRDMSRIRMEGSHPDTETLTPMIEWIDYKEQSKKLGWCEVSRRIELLFRRFTQEDWFAFQRGLLKGFSLEELGGFDGDPSRLFNIWKEAKSFDEARNRIYDSTINLLEIQVKNRGSTLFLDVDKMQYTRASKLIPEIASRRAKEIARAPVHVENGRVNLRNLCLTHHGLSLVMALGLGTTTDSSGLNRLRNAFNQIGLTLNTTDDLLESEVKASSGLKQHVYNLVESSRREEKDERPALWSFHSPPYVRRLDPEE